MVDRGSDSAPIAAGRVRVARLAVDVSPHADWNAAPWQDVTPLRLCYHMGSKPDHFPQTDVKIAHNRHAIHVIFRVEDRYVRAVARKHQDSVCRDSCAEFFFTPGPDPEAGYFNLEINCGGTMLFHYHPAGGADAIEVSASDCNRIALAHSLPASIDPEITEAVTWTLAYAMPVDLLGNYANVARPDAGVTWRGNFYKCGDATSHPHWLTWSPVDFPTPNFHLPEFFGMLVFE